jgi:hypothetical protein
MAIGDQADIVSRLNRLLPPWFGSSNPILSALLNGIAWALSWVYGLIAYAQLQTRLQTATDGFLDLAAYDFFGYALVRRIGQTDLSFRTVILASVLRQRVTRAAIIKVLQDTTGRTPLIVEPSRPVDTGAWDTVVGYWDGPGYWGDPIPYAFFVIAYRPLVGSQWDGVQDADIYAAVEAVRAAGYTAWVQIQN